MKYFDRLVESLSIGDVVTVKIAHLYEKGYGWSEYSDHKYEIESLSQKEIIGKNVDYPTTMIKIDKKDLSEGRFYLKR